MTSQEAKSYLMQYRESLDRTREITQHLGELKSEAVRLKDHEGQSVKLDEATEKYIDACDESADELNRLAELRCDIWNTIHKVEDHKENTLLRMRYISGMTWEQVAVEMHYSYRQTTRLHGKALESVKDVLECPI
jgi:DNA-directed RNA polymerase specialized sigma subunit